VSGLTYDSGLLIAAERGDRRVWGLHRRALERGILPVVPAAVVVEAWRGQALMARLLSGCAVEPLDEESARRAGLLLGACREPVEATDATVVEGALRRRDAVATGNRADLMALAAGERRRLSVIDV
jgi:hypothetical protein